MMPTTVEDTYRASQATVREVEKMVGEKHKKWGGVEPQKIVVASAFVMLENLSKAMELNVSRSGGK